MITFEMFLERKLTDAELEKKDEIVKALEKENEDKPEDEQLPVGAIHAIATDKAKKAA